MFAKRFTDVTVSQIRRVSITTIEKLTRKYPELKEQALTDMERFLDKIEGSGKGIYTFCSSTENHKKKYWELISESRQFHFKFKINRDKSSEVEIVMLQRANYRLEPSFIISRVQQKVGFVYFLKSIHGFKIGCTSRLKTRMNEFGVLLPFDVSLHSIIQCQSYVHLEGSIHKLLDHKRINGEWFEMNKKDFLDLDKYLANDGLRRIDDSVEIERFKSQTA